MLGGRDDDDEPKGMAANATGEDGATFEGASAEVVAGGDLSPDAEATLRRRRGPLVMDVVAADVAGDVFMREKGGDGRGRVRSKRCRESEW